MSEQLETAIEGGPGYLGSKEAHLRGLRQTEGQVPGLQRQVENGTYYTDVLTRGAATRALDSFALALRDKHLRHRCDQPGGTEAEVKVDQASVAVVRLVRS